MALSILDAAANVRQKRAELDTLCRELRDAGAEWTGYSIAIEDAMQIADDGLRNCWTTLDRINGLARAELARAKAAP